MRNGGCQGIEAFDTEQPEQALPKFWYAYVRTRNRPPYLHPEDKKYFDSIEYWKAHPDLKKELSFKEYICSPRFGTLTSDFHFSLAPMPYAGDLSRAVVFILLLNPGFAHNDYYAENQDAAYRKRLDQNIRQDFRGVKFPFFYLDPTFCWTTGFQWWEGKLRRVVQELAQKCFGSNYHRALGFAAHRLASIELIPYHSSSFKEARLIARLPSAQIARKTAENLARTVGKRGGCIVVTRQVAAWGLSSVSDNIVCYSPTEARASHLTPQSKGGEIILRKLESAYLRERS